MIDPLLRVGVYQLFSTSPFHILSFSLCSSKKVYICQFLGTINMLHSVHLNQEHPVTKHII